MYIFFSGHLDVVNILLDCNDIRVNAVNKHDQTPLHFAVKYKFINIVKALIERDDTHLNNITSLGFTAVNLATCANSKDIVKVLLDKGADESIPNNYGLTPFHNANINGFTEIMILLATWRPQSESS